jgi:hypothetical protein
MPELRFGGWGKQFHFRKTQFKMDTTRFLP